MDEWVYKYAHQLVYIATPQKVPSDATRDTYKFKTMENKQTQLPSY